MMKAIETAIKEIIAVKRSLFLVAIGIVVFDAHYSRAGIFKVAPDLSTRSVESADNGSGDVRGNKKSRTSYYLAERKVFTEFVTGKYGASSSEFYRNNNDFDSARRAFTQEAGDVVFHGGFLIWR